MSCSDYQSATVTNPTCTWELKTKVTLKGPLCSHQHYQSIFTCFLICNVDVSTWGRGSFVIFFFFKYGFFPPCKFLKIISIFKCLRNSWFPPFSYSGKQWDFPVPWLMPLAALLTCLGSCRWLDLNYSQRETGGAELAGGEHRAHCHCHSPCPRVRVVTLVAASVISLIQWHHPSSAEVYVHCIFTQYLGLWISEANQE